MARLNGDEKRRLAAVAVRNVKPTDKVQRLADGYGMFLEVRPTGAKYWRYSYRFAGKQKTLALGVYPEISLAQARELHRKAYNQVDAGIDPAQVRQAEKLTKHIQSNNSFELLSREFIDHQLVDKSEGHRNRAERLLLRSLSPLSHRPIAEITAPELLAALRRIESTGTLDSARRACQLAGQVYAYAIQTGRAERNIARDLAGALRPVKQTHRAAITDPAMLGKLLRDMEHSTSGIIVKTAMKLSPLLFQRQGEIRAMEWQEISWDESLWEIPAEKMKMRKEHNVPLPRQAIVLLKELYPLTGHGKYVFPSARGASRCLSDGGVRVALRDMGYTKEMVTPHGFRATARTLLDEKLKYRVDVIEHQLAHAVKDPTGRAYNRTSFLDERREMMQAWADYLDSLKNEAS
ncbi:MAG TPA: integrase arm-type DNA-binding domain-containing protein [Alcanivoracaceae bacterium]|nr:integrase arm-type DNA-binding domain-containing protein [Alcanivoracaceae bacterium]